MTTQLTKLRLLVPKIRYVGRKIDSRGIHPLPENVAAIQHMATPTNISELRSFLGAINFYGNFIVYLQQHCAPFHDLLRNNTKWSWTPQHDVIFKKLKNIISTDDTLVHYDSTLPLVLCTDASDVGVSAVLMQRYDDNTLKPISASSRQLIDAEKKYSTIDKEALAIIYGINKYQQYLYGRRFAIRSDPHCKFCQWLQSRWQNLQCGFLLLTMLLNSLLNAVNHVRKIDQQ